MRRVSWSVPVFLCVLGLFVSAVARADVKLPTMFSDHMVLQREMPLPVWGWADPGESVKVCFQTQCKAATADAAGKWSVTLDAVPAGGPFELTVQGKNTIQCKDVLVGEVWVCSGQSNMAMTVGGSRNREAEVAAAKHPKLRMFTVPRLTAEAPQDKCPGTWQVSSPETVAGFSAAGYFFGRELLEKLDVPVGMLHSSWGGTPIQGWTSEAAQAATPELKLFVDGLKKSVQTWDPAKAQKQYEKALADWKTASAQAKAAKKRYTARMPQPPVSPNLTPGSAGRLYNAMIAPLVPYAIRGAIWYQGEANAGNGKLYAVQLRTMITSWRQVWNEGDFPFIAVQLPGFMAPQKQPSEGGWAMIREAFLQTLAVPNAGMAVTIDVGEEKDIHPKDKQTVGKRLAQWALAKTYGKDVVACGPLYKGMRQEGAKIVCEFDYAEGLAAREAAQLKGFAIAGADKKFVWAEAQVVGNTVVVSSDKIASPAAVRYAWASNPECNLVNGAGLPASPFRTDNWEQ